MFPVSELGAFIENGRAYRVTTAFPPRPLENVLQSDDGYYAQVSHWGTGTATLQFPDGEVNRVVNADRKTLYCRDEDPDAALASGGGAVWCPGVYPMMSDVEGFFCEHHETFTTVSSERDGVRVTWRLFVPRRGTREIWTVTLENLTDHPRRLSLVPAANLSLTGFKAPRFFETQHHCSTCDYRQDVGGLYFEGRNPNPKGDRYNVVLAASRPLAGYTGDALYFLGAPMAFHYPQALLAGDVLPGKLTYTGEPFVAIQVEVALEARAVERTDILFSVVRSPEEARREVIEIQSPDRVNALLEDVRSAVRRRRENLQIATPDPKIDAFVNTWLRKGLEFCLLRKDATRDNLQFADGLTMSDPARVRAEILKVLRYQYADGHTVRSWVPLDTTYYGDGPIWIVLTTCGYLKFSDDMDLLDEPVPYFDGGEGPVREHLERAVQRLDEDRGPHGLCLIRYADWNDALNLKDPQAESVFITMALGMLFDEMAALTRYLGHADEAARFHRKHAELKALVNRVAWDEEGGYYVRAFYDGKTLGSTTCEHSRIFVNPQSWAILGAMVPEERLPRVLRALDEIIEMDLGCPVNIPGIARWNERLGRISAQLPGTGENGSVYCHATAFKTAADVLLGRGDAALRCLHKILPDSEQNPAVRSGATPFALTSCYNTHPACYGKAGRPWLTGTQAWMMRAVVEGLLGVRRACGGFEIAPAFPSSWREARVALRRAGATYHFVLRRAGCSTLTVTLDGRRLERPFLPFQDGGDHEILVAVPEG